MLFRAETPISEEISQTLRIQLKYIKNPNIHQMGLVSICLNWRQLESTERFFCDS